MTKIVGLTGGIGSGKTTVAQMFKALGVPVYNADDEAKALMQSSEILKRELIQLLGVNCYQNEQLNRSFIASKVFADKALLEKINAIVHPKVAAHFEAWHAKQNTPYVIKEVAILFETGSQHLFDFILTVTAPVETRIQRVMDRDQKTKSDVELVIKNQLSEDEKINQSHFVIFNNTILETQRKVQEIHNEILKLIENS
ncbi:dephospho-CoA kinase [Formosa sp. Hel1_33_131]|jgi:dephospho-CoA kinase|uniref:dephospho-CoA kinase n=1 Tax=Formosa sp. Hel1_33_131 TaxID=1336794 RepID=UPI00084E2CF2|nr:dephospho-CoA kinase [Formosa sp. Hel1_33_131]AOR29189.1 dephospho-CoA kinase [Formosa sp. Hel1_33_131]